MSSFKITGPGFYLDREGDRVEVVGRSVQDMSMPWVGFGSLGELNQWNDNGHCVDDDCKFSGDIVAVYGAQLMRAGEYCEVGQ